MFYFVLILAINQWKTTAFIRKFIQLRSSLHLQSDVVDEIESLISDASIHLRQRFAHIPLILVGKSFRFYSSNALMHSRLLLSSHFTFTITDKNI